MKIKILSDSTCDLPESILKQYDISLTPLSVIKNDEVFKDGITITPAEIFEHVANGGDLCTTSAVSVGEYQDFYEKYAKDYAASLDRIREARRIFFEGLQGIKGLRPIPSEANYITAEITSGMSAKALTKRLLLDNNLFIKDLSGKVGGEYIRLAVRSIEDNDRLLAALSRLLG